MTIRSRARSIEVICSFGIDPTPEHFRLSGRLSIRSVDEVSRVAAAYTSITWSDAAPRAASMSFDDDTFVVDFDQKDRPIGVEVLALTERPGPELWSFVRQHRGSVKGDTTYLATHATSIAWLRLEAALQSANGSLSNALESLETTAEPTPSWVAAPVLAVTYSLAG